MISSLVLLATILALGTPAALVLIPWTVITGDATQLYNAAMTIVRTGFRLARIRVETTGIESVPAQTACIFMANHVSNLDPPALIPRIPGRTSVFLKRSLMKIPVLGYGMKLGEFVPVDRDGRTESAIESVRVARQVLRRGCTLQRLWKAHDPATEACCHSRKARSIWQWRQGRPAYQCRFMEPKA